LLLAMYLMIFPWNTNLPHQNVTVPDMSRVGSWAVCGKKWKLTPSSCARRARGGAWSVFWEIKGLSCLGMENPYRESADWRNPCPKLAIT
jgi:hypothetical protein